MVAAHSYSTLKGPFRAFLSFLSEAERLRVLRVCPLYDWLNASVGTALRQTSHSKRLGVMQKAAVPVSDDLKGTLRWTTESLREIYGSRLKRLILFGSQARGDARPESDVDLLVVLEGPITSIEEAKRTSRVGTQAAAYRDTALSFVHMSEEEFARGRSPLVWSVREDGIDLLELFSESATPEPASSSESDRNR
ncbi:nucleotidyltransferase domain-containing protein [Salinibacter ruber]|nr:nucleotidyltransferase domain-containing protein [Salinibacter ruber]